MSERGRPRKARVNDIVEFNDGGHGVIVAYRNTVKSNRYAVIDSDWKGGRRGFLRWLEPSEFVSTGRQSVIAGRIYRANQREPDRGCESHCCVHVAGFDVEG
jgi:hypothetical protein